MRDIALVIPNGQAASVLAMLTPTASVLLMQLVVTGDGWHRGGWSGLGVGRLAIRFWPAAVLLALGTLFVSEVAVGLTGLTSWHLPALRADIVIELPILVLFTLGEELGWRGYLFPLLAADGRRFPGVRTGLLHGVWHLPLVFVATGAYLTDGSHWLTVPIFLGVMASSGPVYGWLRQASGSVWPAVLAHLSFNLGLGVVAANVTTSHADTVAVLGRESGIATLAVLGAVACWVSTWPRPVAVPMRAGQPVAAAAGEGPRGSSA